MNEQRRDHFLVEIVGFLGTTDHSAERDVLVMKENIPDKCGFSSTTTANENTDGILWDLSHAELFELKIHRCGGHIY